MDRLRIKSKVKGLAFLLCQDSIEENKKQQSDTKKIIKKLKIWQKVLTGILKECII